MMTAVITGVVCLLALAIAYEVVYPQSDAADRPVGYAALVVLAVGLVLAVPRASRSWGVGVLTGLGVTFVFVAAAWFVYALALVTGGAAP
ncbi:hypothetical protein SAMN05421872_108265 [Nocardioides lianchengensis]|uniref:Uncharacterized protein n=2 Tax=Nocardioides lianchengensis TaxID=1045774 RepID=A0A1G6VB93_9ACTN|nr:hypothetical protein SAMN05421872_108265 [Nocardioides lianchengensis]